MLNKTCSKCNIVLLEQNISCNKRQCKPCYNTYHKIMFQKHKDKHREMMYNWRKKNKDKVRTMLVNNAVKTHGSVSKCVNHYVKKAKEQVADSYIRSLLTKSKRERLLKSSDIPQELIDMKRTQLILTRKIKNNGKDQSSNSSN